MINLFSDNKNPDEMKMWKERRIVSTTAQIMQVEEVLNKLRPFIQSDGGDVELVDVDDGVVKVRLLGACGTCPASTITLKAGIERALVAEVEGIKEVEQVL